MRLAFTGFAYAKRRNWHPYNPNAERGDLIEVEVLDTDPIHQFTTFDKDNQEVEPTAPDFDL